MRKMAIYGLKTRYARSSSIAKVEILYSGGINHNFQYKKPRDSTRLTQHFFFFTKRKPVLKEKTKKFFW